MPYTKEELNNIKETLDELILLIKECIDLQKTIEAILIDIWKDAVEEIEKLKEMLYEIEWRLINYIKRKTHLQKILDLN